MTILRNDILPSDLTQEQARVIVKSHLDSIIESTIGPKPPTPFGAAKSRSSGSAKDVYEFCELVRQVLNHRQSAEHTAEDAKVILTQEMSDVDQRLEAVTFALEKRVPGQFSDGAPFSGDVKNYKPRVRETFADPDNPGYRKVVMGFWMDNLVNFTCWARTNKEANNRSMWFERLMDDYTWFYELNGVSRVWFWDRGPDVEKTADTTSTQQSTTNKYYGRPMLYFVRTERISTVSEKELEQLIINLSVNDK